MTVRKSLSVTLLVVLAVAAAACGDDSAADTTGASGTTAAAPTTTARPDTTGSATTAGAAAAPATPEDLDGRVLIATSVTEDGADRPLVEGTELRVSFEEPEFIGVAAGCNSMGGPYTLEDGRLTAPNMAQTMMACEEERMDQDAWIAALLAAGVDVTVDGDTVTFTGDGTVIELGDADTVSPDESLIGTTWVLSDLLSAGGSTAAVVPGGVVATLVIDENGAYLVDTGCNSGGGQATVGTTTIEFGPMALTRRACTSDEAQQVETAMVTVLDGEATYEIVDGFLRIINGDDGLGFLGG